MRRGKHRISRGKLRWYLLGAAVIALAFAGWRKWQAPEASDLYAAAEVARKQGALKEAIIRYKSFLQAKPEDLTARWRLGQTYLALHQPAAALSELTRASALAATTPELQLDIGRAHIELREYTKALELLESYRGPQSPELDALKVKAKLGEGKTEAAKHLLDAARQRSPQDSSLAVATARLALAQHDLSGADASLNDALKTMPENLEALILKARIALMQGQMAAAASGFQRALQLAPENLEALAGLSKAQIASQQLPQAADTVARFKRQAPNIDEGLLLTGMLAYAKADWGRATGVLGEFVDHQPTNRQALLMLAGSYFHQGNYQQAEARLNALDKLAPNHAPARKLMAVVLLKQRRGADAVAALRPLLEDTTQPPDAGVLTLLSQAYAANGDATRAQEVLEQAKAAASSSSLAAQTQLALAQSAGSSPEAGLSALNRLAEQAPADLEVRQNLTAGQLAQGDLSAAQESARLLLELAPDAPLSHHLAGLAYLRAGDAKRAAAAFSAALERDPGFAPALVNQGLMALKAENAALARSKLEAALKADDANVPATLLLANLKAREGDVAGALALLSATLERRPDEPELRWQLAENLLRTGELPNALANAEKAFNAAAGAPASQLRWGAFQLRAQSADGAFKTLSSLHEQFPDDARTTALLGDAARLTTRYADARQHYVAVLKVHPELLPLWWSLFATELGERQYAAAAQVVTQLRERFPQRVDAENAAGELATVQGKFDDATTAFRAVFEKAPSSRALQRLVAAQRLQRDTDGAHESLTQWLARNPDDADARITLGLLEIAAKQWPAARRAFEQVLASRPNHPVALSGLAKVYDRLDDPRGLALAERGHEALKGDPFSADTLGWILVRKQRVQRGLALLEDAHHALPEEPEIAYHYAYALAEAGMKDKAHAAAEALLRKHPAFDAREETETLLLTLRGSDATAPDQLT